MINNNELNSYRNIDIVWVYTVPITIPSTFHKIFLEILIFQQNYCFNNFL